MINDALYQMVVSELPFGGVGNSGIGHIHGDYGFNRCSHMRAVCDARMFNTGIFSMRFPPYTPNKQRLLKFALNWLGAG